MIDYLFNLINTSSTFLLGAINLIILVFIIYLTKYNLKNFFLIIIVSIIFILEHFSNYIILFIQFFLTYYLVIYYTRNQFIK